MDTIEINAEALEGLVVQTLSVHVRDCNDELFEGLQEHVKQLSNHTRCQDHKLCNFQEQQSCTYDSNTRLNEIALALETVIQTTPSLPAHVTAETHSKIGLLRQKQGNSTGAIQSFLKALWIQSSLPSADTTERKDLLWKIAMTKHRLGLAFGRSGNFKDAVRLLENALHDYQELLSNDSPRGDRYNRKLMEQAETALHNTRDAQTFQTVLASSKKSLSSTISSSPTQIRRSTTISVPGRRAKSGEQSN